MVTEIRFFFHFKRLQISNLCTKIWWLTNLTDIVKRLKFASSLEKIVHTIELFFGAREDTKVVTHMHGDQTILKSDNYIS